MDLTWKGRPKSRPIPSWLPTWGPPSGWLPPLAGQAMWEYSHMAKTRGLALPFSLYKEGSSSSVWHPNFLYLSLSHLERGSAVWSCAR